MPRQIEAVEAQHQKAKQSLFELFPPDTSPGVKEGRGHGRTVSWDVYDADGALVDNYIILSDAITRRRVRAGRYIRLALDPRSA